tara:strand:+ start:1060 stop:1299 length:240 start_codon:yes stop_codon:yes gene_type:complete
MMSFLIFVFDLEYDDNLLSGLIFVLMFMFGVVHEIVKFAYLAIGEEYYLWWLAIIISFVLALIFDFILEHLIKYFRKNS